MRTRKKILLWSEAEGPASDLAFALSISLHVTVERAATACELKAALGKHTYDLLILIDSERKRGKLMHLAGPAIPVLVTGANRQQSNATLFDTAKSLMAHKRGPVPAEHPVRRYAEVS
jgi:hypothetical protein